MTYLIWGGGLTLTLTVLNGSLRLLNGRIHSTCEPIHIADNLIRLMSGPVTLRFHHSDLAFKGGQLSIQSFKCLKSDESISKGRQSADDCTYSYDLVADARFSPCGAHYGYWVMAAGALGLLFAIGWVMALLVLSGSRRAWFCAFVALALSVLIFWNGLTIVELSWACSSSDRGYGDLQSEGMSPLRFLFPRVTDPWSQSYRIFRAEDWESYRSIQRRDS